MITINLKKDLYKTSYSFSNDAIAYGSNGKSTQIRRAL